MKVIFIGGTGRSGTTITRKILLRHSMTYGFTDEARFLVDPDGVLDLVDTLSNRWSPYNAEIVLRRFESLMKSCFLYRRFYQLKHIFNLLNVNPPKYSYLNLCNRIEKNHFLDTLNQYISQLRYHISDASWLGSPPFQRKGLHEIVYLTRDTLEKMTFGFLKELLSGLKEYSENKYWVEDTPYNLLQAHRLYKLFPDMKLLHVYRDPKDVISSTKYMHWADQDVLINAERLVNVWKRWKAVRNNLPEECYLEFNLKDLVNNTEKTLQYICEFLGLPFEEEMLKESLDKSHSGRWKKDIDNSLVKDCDTMLNKIYREIERVDDKNKLMMDHK